MAKRLKVYLSYQRDIGLLQAEAVSESQKVRLDRKYNSYSSVAWRDSPIFAETVAMLSKKAAERLSNLDYNFLSVETTLPVDFFENWIENSTATRNNPRKKHHPNTPLYPSVRHDLIEIMVRGATRHSASPIKRLDPSEYSVTLAWSGSAEDYEEEYEHYGVGDQYFKVKIFDFKPRSVRLKKHFKDGDVAFGNDYEGWHTIEDH